MWKDLKREFFDQANVLTRLIVVNLAVFFGMHILNAVLMLTGNAGFFDTLDYWLSFPSSLDLLLFRPWTVLTYNLVHAGLFHIFFNILILYWFGSMFMEMLGSKRVLGLFFTGGLFGALFFMLAYNIFPIFNNAVQFSNLRGASAGVFAFVFAMVALSPDRKMHLLLVGAVKLKVIGLILLGINLIDTVGGNAGGAFAHLGGAAFGYLYVQQLRKGRDLTAWWTAIMNWFTKTEKSNLKVVHKSSNKTSSYEYDEEKVNRILDKISKSGYPSLTESEKTYLLKVSKDK